MRESNSTPRTRCGQAAASTPRAASRTPRVWSSATRSESGSDLATGRTHRAVAQLLQDPSRHLGLVPRLSAFGGHDPVHVAHPGEQHDVLWPSQLECLADGPVAVRDEEEILPAPVAGLLGAGRDLLEYAHPV